ncbi:MAG: ABC transporter permease subunit, partial [Bacteroidetes bacterium]
MRPTPLRHLPVLIFLLLTALPVGAGLLYALLYSFGMAGPGGGPTLRYWQEAWSNTEIPQTLLFSAWIALASTLLALLPALAAALSGHFRSGILSGVIYAPLTLPAMAVAFLGFQVLGQSGWLARMAAGMGFLSNPAQFPELIQDAWGTGIIISHALMAFPFFTLLLLQVVESERISELQQLSYTLGASPRQSLLRVSLPLLLRRV